MNKQNRYLLVVPAALLVFAAFTLPYDYYTFLRWFITAAASYLAYYYAQKENNKLWLYIAVAILFNPLVPFGFSKGTWVLFDLAVAVIFLIPLADTRFDQRTSDHNVHQKDEHESIPSYDLAALNHGGEKYDIAGTSIIAKWPAFVRWVLLLPAAIIAAIGITIILKLVNALSPGQMATWWVDLTSSAAMGFVFVYIGSALAPRRQFETSLVLLVLLTLLSASSFLGSLLPGSTVGPLVGGLHAVLVLITGVAAVIAVKTTLESKFIEYGGSDIAGNVQNVPKDLLDSATVMAISSGKVSASFLRRVLDIDYQTAEELLAEMKRKKIISGKSPLYDVPDSPFSTEALSLRKLAKAPELQEWESIKDKE